MKRSLSLFCALSLVSGVALAADWQSALQSFGISGKSSLNDTPVANGLKEALKVGIDNTVKTLGKSDGYLKNEAVKILLPERLRGMDGILRKVGLGPQMDEVVLSMNRAAESAAPAAKDIFVDSIVGMSIDDAQSILKGSNTAATDYLKRSSSARLTEAFKPAIRQAMGRYGVTAKYQAVADRYKALPLAGKFPLPSIEDYVTQKSLDGLFLTLGKEEAQIRKDPAARVTPLLKKIFA